MLLQWIKGSVGSTDKTTCTSDGLETFTDSKSVMARWSEYFQQLLNVPGDIEAEALKNIFLKRWTSSS